jgi:hypothetical protein
MNTKEKIALATQNNKLYCFKEGMFFKVYNQNAMWFTQHIKVYKINSKFVKTVNQQVFSIGFPQSLVLANLLVSQNKALLKIEETQGFIAYKINRNKNEKNTNINCTNFYSTTNHSPNHYWCFKIPCRARVKPYGV